MKKRKKTDLENYDKESMTKEQMKIRFKELMNTKLNERYEKFPNDDRGNKAINKFCKEVVEEIDWIE